jgi:hypothetical protein
MMKFKQNKVNKMQLTVLLLSCVCWLPACLSLSPSQPGRKQRSHHDLTLTTACTREYLMYYRGQCFLVVVWFCPPPLPSAVCYSLSVFLCVAGRASRTGGRKGGGGSQIIFGEKAGPRYFILTTLWHALWKRERFFHILCSIGEFPTMGICSSLFSKFLTYMWKIS